MKRALLVLMSIALCSLISSCTVNQYYVVKSNKPNKPRLDDSFNSSIVVFTDKSSASGAIIKIVDDNTSYAITVKHFCDPAKQSKIYAVASPHSAKAFQKFSAKIDRVHRVLDLCVLKLNGDTTKIKEFKILNRYPTPGEKIFSLGAPAGSWPNKNVGFVSSIIKSKQASENNLDFSDVLMVSLPASPGSSGSPIYNQDGKMVGVVIAVHSVFHHNSIGITSVAILDFTSYIR